MSKLKLLGSSSGHTMLSAPASAGSNTLVLPPNNGSAGQVLSTDGNGNLTWVSQPTVVDNNPSWSAYRNSAWGAASGQWLLVPYNATYWDANSVFTPVSGGGEDQDAKFTVPSGKAGKYFIKWGIKMGGIDDTEYILLRLFKNGSEWIGGTVRDYATTTDQNIEFGGTEIMDLAVGDYIQVKLYQNSGAGQLHEVPSATFSGFRLAGV